MKNRVLFVILDGLGDRPIKKFYGKTPLEAAKKSYLDKMVKFSECGMHIPTEYGEIVESDVGHTALFGYSKRYDIGRGIYEALGMDIKLSEGDIAMRVNFATVDDNKLLIDRRAGRDDYGLEHLILDFYNELDKISSKYGVKIILKKGVEHRGVLVIKGLDSEINVSENDPHKEGTTIGKIISKDKNSNVLAELLNKIIESFHEFSKRHVINKERAKKGKLPANYILIRGIGKYKELASEEKFQNKYNIKSAFIAGAPMYLGIAKYFGIDTFKPIGATGTVKTSLVSKAQEALAKKHSYDIVFVHIKATDSLSHDKKPNDKKKFIEKIDTFFFSRVYEEFEYIVVTGDHSTSSIHGKHISDPVPFMVHSNIVENIRKDPVKKFGERWCYKGMWGTIKARDIIKIILSRIKL